jgi:hypothetical protein
MAGTSPAMTAEKWFNMIGTHLIYRVAVLVGTLRFAHPAALPFHDNAL